MVATATALLVVHTLNTTAPQAVGGLTFSVAPTDAPTLFAEADGSLFLSGSSGAWAVVDLRLILDGVAVQTVRTQVLNYGAGNQSSSWHLHALQSVDPGTHDVHVEAQLVGSAGGVVQVDTPSKGRLSTLLLR